VHIHTLESTTEDLRAEVAELNSKLAERSPPPSPPPLLSPPPSYMENSKLIKVTWLLRDFLRLAFNFIRPARIDVSTETEFPTKVDAGVATEVDTEQTVCQHLHSTYIAWIEIEWAPTIH
jgi:hypothetical protein